MKTCWEVLEIAPTIDINFIKTARRTLMKSWHPDIAGAVDEKASYNARCAEINAAYDQAVIFARAWRPARSTSSDSEPQRRHRFSMTTTHPFASLQTLAFIGMMFFVLASRSGFRLFLMLIPFGFVLALIAAADWLVLQFAIRRVLPAAAPRPYKKIAAWLLLAIGNIVVLSFGLAEIGSLLFGLIGGLVFDVTVGLAVPLWISLSRW